MQLMCSRLLLACMHAGGRQAGVLAVLVQVLSFCAHPVPAPADV